MAKIKSGSTTARLAISAVIATYRREQVLIDTIHYLLQLESGPDEIVVVDQTTDHEPSTRQSLTSLANADRIRTIKLDIPSITHAMNVGLQVARNDIVLFLDDDIIPGENLIDAHARTHAQDGCNIVAGQVLQPGEEPVREDPGGGGFRFCSDRAQYISDLMGGNFSINRDVELRLGGFDENFIHVAYRFEAEFAARALAAGEKILFEPDASIRHLKASTGGTRSYGRHLSTIRPSHSVGEYYYLLRSKRIRGRTRKILARPLRAIRTRYHLSHPWWIPGTLFAEAWGFLWAVALLLQGPRLIGDKRTV